jgi:hypothetical protein
MSKSLHVKNQWLVGVGSIFSCQKLIAYNRLVMVMGSVSWRGGSWEVAKPTAIAWLKMEHACILCNVIETFWQRKLTKTKRWRHSGLFKIRMALAQSCKNISTCLCRHPNTSIAKGRNWLWGVSCDNFFVWLELH